MTFNIVPLDVETTTIAKGNPFHVNNKLVTVGIDEQVFWIEHTSLTTPPGANYLHIFKRAFDDVDIFVGHNIKFDIHWVKNYYPAAPIKNVWDTQLAEYIISNQKHSLASLDDLSRKYNVDSKLGTMKEYWDKGIDTFYIPTETIRDYLKRDLLVTMQVQEKQKEILLSNPKKHELFKLHCQDLLVLQEMEFNGLIFDHKAANELKEQTNLEIESLDEHLKCLFPAIPINFNSSAHLSALLYGGYLKYNIRVPYQHTLKDGRVKDKVRTETKSILFPRLVEPKKGTEGSETKKLTEQELQWANISRLKEGKALIQRLYSVDQTILKSLHPKNKTAKALITLVLKRSELNKLVTTYYDGLPKIIQENGWKDNEIHGQFNQTITVTGRLSSSNPNEQNFSGQIKHLFRSRFE